MTADVWAYFYFMQTARAKKTAKIIAENGGNKPISQAMKEAGFSDAYAKNPQKLTRTKSWKDIMDKYLPDEKLGRIHKKLLESKKFTSRSFPLDMEDDNIRTIIRAAGATPLRIFEGKNEADIECKKCFFSYPDNMVIDKALDKAYKLKGRYSETIEVKSNLRNLSNTELMERINELSKVLKKK
ncbi:MAG: hypothetical protein PHQ46_11280 [Negativicutes bacterium]|nr:hypothetical protein [Negativicutes bacterium]